MIVAPPQPWRINFAKIFSACGRKVKARGDKSLRVAADNLVETCPAIKFQLKRVV